MRLKWKRLPNGHVAGAARERSLVEGGEDALRGEMGLPRHSGQAHLNVLLAGKPDGLPYLPLKTGSRFSRKEATPSR